jgi:uncharacterized membrane protein YgcG
MSLQQQEDNNSTSPGQAAAAAEYAASASLRLPEFWPDTPSSWFAFVESKFRVRGIVTESVKFDLLVGCLPRASLRQVLDVIEHPHATEPYTALKQRLLSAHELTKFQRIEALFKMESLGGRKPSELLAQMLELCPRGEERNPFFIFLFLQRLPRELRVLLGDEALEEPRDLAEKADKLWALHSHQHGVVAAVEGEEEEAPVAAVKPQPYRHRGGKKGGRGRGRGGGGGGASSGQQNAEPVTPNQAPAALARMSTGLCHFHWTYGEKAQRCEAPCNWGN